MNCDVVKDLIPLYIDGCCSEESSAAVREHLAHCQTCKHLAEEMSAEFEVPPTAQPPASMKPLNQWKASVLQSVLLFLSFAVITVGVALEAKIPAGLLNGFWAFNLVIPSTGFMLSLTNWHFLPIYKNRKTFSNCSLLATAIMTSFAFAWCLSHYEIDLFALFAGTNAAEFIERLVALWSLDSIGIWLSVIFCIMSKALSGLYANWIGKE